MPEQIVFTYYSSNRAWNGDELWVLTPDGPRPYASVYPVGRVDGATTGATLDNGLLIFNGQSEDTSPSLWVTDGTPSGTHPLVPIENFRGHKLISVGDRVFFLAETPETGLELWVTDGTSAGTRMVRDIYPGPESSRPLFSIAGGGAEALDLVPFGNGVLFFASDGTEGDNTLVAPYFSDGTAEGTVRLTEVPLNYHVSTLTRVEFDTRAVLPDMAYFMGNSDEFGGELWVTDGTPEGTRMVMDIRPGPLSSEPDHLALLGDQLFFAAHNGVDRFPQVWTSDGTEAGTRQLTSDLNLVYDFTVVNGHMLFTANDHTHGRELWITDGTEAGTRLLMDTWEGPDDGVWTVLSRTLYTVGNGERAVFVAQERDHGRELWVTDGTEAGTHLLMDIHTEGGSYPSSAPENFMQVGGLVYFSAFDTEAGNTLWVTDGTEAGTRLVADAQPNSDGSEILPVGWVDVADPSLTLDGTPGADTLNGADGDDTLSGLAGDDLLQGHFGYDSLDGGAGADTLVGGVGNDVLIGGPADQDLRDLIYGGDGDDLIDGGAGNDELRGDAGADTITGGAGVDTIIGGDGDDVLTGQTWSDVILGGDGEDFINGGFGHDRVNGGADGDRFFHLGVEGHGSDWIQDFDDYDGDLLVFGGTGATAADFQVNFTETAAAGAAGVQEAFVIYRPTGQILWALVDGAAQDVIGIVIDGTEYDLLS